MSSKLVNHEINIGDIDVYSDEHYVQVTVDGDTAVFISRVADGGLKDLVETLNKLIK